MENRDQAVGHARLAVGRVDGSSCGRLGSSTRCVAALFLFVPFILILRSRHADKSRRRNAMLEALAEPIWARVLSEWLALTAVIVGVGFLTRDDPLNLWTLASVMAKIYLIAAPLLVACFVWLAISERRNVMAALARETANEQQPSR